MEFSEPTGYEDEPAECFEPLPAALLPEFYHLQTAHVTEDTKYFLRQLRQYQCKSVLELGCGTGRIAEQLQAQGFAVTGIDLCAEMLRFRHRQRSVPAVQMDMCRLGFSRCFDAAIIAYNTLNLLIEQQNIRRCLGEIRQVLGGPRLLLLQLFTPDRALLDAAHRRLFQFHIFERPQGGTLITETIRTYYPESKRLRLEQRYKLRPLPPGGRNQNFSHPLELASFSCQEWLALLRDSGYAVQTLHGSYEQHSYQPEHHTILLVASQSA